MKLIVCLLILILFNRTKCCLQAWNGGGTGAWYRVDTSCRYSFISTQLIYCLPKIILPFNSTKLTDGFFVSLGIFNRFNGYSLDIGLTYDFEKTKWFSYGNDRIGWKSGNISIDSKLNPCINVSLSIINQSINYLVRTENGSILLGQDIYLSSQIDPFLNLTKNNSNFGFYRFDSIAQDKETLKTGSQMINSIMNYWILELDSKKIVLPNQYYIASNVSGFSPGPCCTKDEINTITIHQQTEWNQSDISIRYI